MKTNLNKKILISDDEIKEKNNIIWNDRTNNIKNFSVPEYI